MSKLDDCTREYLVTKFVCAECGRALKLSYVRAAASVPYVSGEPTGADKVENAVRIYPCDTCMAPVNKVKAALAALSEVAKGFE